MILNLTHVQKTFIDDEVIKDATFLLEDHEKAALIGLNGAGKTTLFNLITGTLPLDSGTVTVKKGAVIAYLMQHEEFNSEKTVYEEVLSVRESTFRLEEKMRALEEKMTVAKPDELPALLSEHTMLRESFDQENGYAIQSEVQGVLKGLGFSENQFSLPVSVLSGGEKTRIALARLLIKKPDLLLLDEPTNHLDMDAIAFLETYLKNYKSAVLFISHDRYFIDTLATKVLALENGIVQSYLGNYSDYTVKHAAELKDKERAYEKQQAEIEHQTAVIDKLRSFKVERFYKRAESRQKILDKMQLLSAPKEEDDEFFLSFTPKRETGNDVLTVEGLAKRYEGKTLFSDFSLLLKKRDRLAIIGPNGAGKTTLLRLLLGEVPVSAGTFRWGANVDIGYYDQEHAVLSFEKTIFEEISDAYPRMTNTEIRNHLALFLFTEDDVYKRIGDLSGGEKGRVSLAKLMLLDANVLVLDEPTNHLDMTGKEILEKALNAFPGTVITVSHDRYFMKQTATRIAELYEGQILLYEGNYDYYREKKDLFHERFHTESIVEKKISESAVLRRVKKEEDAVKRRRMREKAALEESLAHLEESLEELTKEMEKPENGTNAALLQSLAEEKKEKETEWEEIYQKIEEYTD